MSLYGLDIIVAKDGRRVINEINGILSGMKGFQQLYGDNRVEEKVFDMLQKQYGNLSVNNGTFRRNQFKKEHPFRFGLGYMLVRTPLVKKLFSLPSSTLMSRKAEIEWLSDKASNSNPVELPFDSYDGQDSTVINVWNEELPHPTVNPVVAESISRNKFLQYILLHDSDIADAIMKSSLVGLGATNEKELEEMLSNHGSFVVKPILGSCGRGVQFLTKDEVEEKYRNSRGPIDYVNPMEGLLAVHGKKRRLLYIEDLIEQEDYSFEPGVSIIQPFIDSEREGTYYVIRAIVCNGEFIDAYQRVSSSKRVNLSQDAIAKTFDYNRDFAMFCEKTVGVFEEKSQEHSAKDYKRTLYNRYIEERGVTFDVQRDLDRTSPLMDAMFNMMKQ